MKEKMILASDNYFRALSSMDQESYLSCFSTDAELHDPYGGKPMLGSKGLARWYSGFELTWASFKIKPEARYFGANRTAVHWLAEGHASSGKSISFTGVNIFTIDDSGLISRLESYWDVKSVLSQIG